jgi:hypothetical protein
MLLDMPMYCPHACTNMSSPEAKFIVLDWGDKVDSGIGLLYRHARKTQAGRPVQQPNAIILYSGTMNLAAANCFLLTFNIACPMC